MHIAGSELQIEEAHRLHPGHEDFAWDPQLELFTDGTCWQPQTSMARAACAVVQVDPESGELIRFAVFPLPRDYRQTAAAAEHVAIELAAFYSRGEGKKRVQTECASVCAASKQRGQYSLHKVASGGFWWSCPPSWEFHKVKAHLSLTQVFPPRHGQKHLVRQSVGRHNCQQGAYTISASAITSAGGTGKAPSAAQDFESSSIGFWAV